MRYQGQPSAFRMRFQRRFLQAAARFAMPAGLFQKSSSFIWRAALRDQHRLLEVAAGALQRVAELFFAAAAKPSQYIFAAPNKLGIDCLDIDHETFVNPTKPYHDQRRQEVERHPLTQCRPSFASNPRSARDRCQARLDNRRFPVICFRFLLAVQRNLACSRLSLWL